MDWNLILAFAVIFWAGWIARGIKEDARRTEEEIERMAKRWPR